MWKEEALRQRRLEEGDGEASSFDFSQPPRPFTGLKPERDAVPHGYVMDSLGSIAHSSGVASPRIRASGRRLDPLLPGSQDTTANEDSLGLSMLSPRLTPRGQRLSRYLSPREVHPALRHRQGEPRLHPAQDLRATPPPPPRLRHRLPPPGGVDGPGLRERNVRQERLHEVIDGRLATVCAVREWAKTEASRQGVRIFGTPQII